MTLFSVGDDLCFLLLCSHVHFRDAHRTAMWELGEEEKLSAFSPWTAEEKKNSSQTLELFADSAE